MAQLWGGEGTALLSKAKLGQSLHCSEVSSRLQGSQGLSQQMLPCMPCPAITWPEAGGALVLHLATEKKLGLCKADPWLLPGERAGGPHITVLQRPGPHIS